MNIGACALASHLGSRDPIASVRLKTKSSTMFVLKCSTQLACCGELFYYETVVL